MEDATAVHPPLEGLPSRSQPCVKACAPETTSRHFGRSLRTRARPRSAGRRQPAGPRMRDGFRRQSWGGRDPGAPSCRRRCPFRMPRTAGTDALLGDLHDHLVPATVCREPSACASPRTEQPSPSPHRVRHVRPRTPTDARGVPRAGRAVLQRGPVDRLPLRRALPSPLGPTPHLRPPWTPHPGDAAQMSSRERSRGVKTSARVPHRAPSFQRMPEEDTMHRRTELGPRQR